MKPPPMPLFIAAALFFYFLYLRFAAVGGALLPSPLRWPSWIIQAAAFAVIRRARWPLASALAVAFALAFLIQEAAAVGLCTIRRGRCLRDAARRLPF